MSGIEVDSRSLRSERLRANAPRLAFYLGVAILSLAGLRAIVAGTPAPVVQASSPASVRADVAVEAFAESFARAYLSWDSFDLEERQRQLAGFTSDSLAGAGVEPAEDSSQSVTWTSVTGLRREGERTLVTVAAQTGAELVYLSVPVARNGAGALYVAGYPAFVGPPTINTEAGLAGADDEEVQEGELRAVALRAVANYVARDRGNLAADLTEDAVVSLPTQPMSIVHDSFGEAGAVTWVAPDRRVAAVVEAEDENGSTWTLRYELNVERSDRWYVRSIQVDPTSTGGS